MLPPPGGGCTRVEPTQAQKSGVNNTHIQYIWPYLTGFNGNYTHTSHLPNMALGRLKFASPEAWYIIYIAYNRHAYCIQITVYCTTYIRIKINMSLKTI